MPELVTNSILAPVAACSKTVKFWPSRSTKERLSTFGAGVARVREVKERRAVIRLMEKTIFGNER